MNRIHFMTFGFAALLVAGLAVTALGQATASNAAPATESVTTQVRPTLENLQTAFYAESNASVLYTQYAIKADEEGYAQLASMFRAIAHGEEIHATNCAALIKEMGETPKVVDEQPVVLTTLENLAAADATQIYETDVMYPKFIEQARREKNKTAEETFSHNMAAEPAHHALFQQALKDIEGYKGESTTFLVCSNCGYATRALNASTCPVCSNPKEQFAQVK